MQAGSQASLFGGGLTCFGRYLTFRALFLIVVWICGNAASRADEPILEFVAGLRERGYYDSAADYLNQVMTRSGVDPDVRNVLDFELGLTLKQWGAQSRVAADREQRLAAAEASLQKFLSANATHEKAAEASSLLGELLFDRAESLIWETERIETAAERAAVQGEARALIDRARGIFQASHDQYKAAYQGFPKFIDESKEPELLEQRKTAENRYLRAWLNLARCTYERGQTFDRGSEERKQTLIQASEEFSAIHTSRRTNSNGLYAQLMMARCFQEQDDIGRALGIYNELLKHESQAAFMMTLKGTAKHFRLICLNSPERNDSTLVIQEATTWLQQNRQLSTTTFGLGILWEQAQAEEKASQPRELPENERNNYLRFAMNHAEQVAKYPGAFRLPAESMVRRLRLALGDQEKEPKDFDSAFERARGMIAQIQELNDALSEAEDEAQRAAGKAALDSHLSEVGRLLTLALSLREPDSDPKAIAQTRYLLGFVRLRQGNPLDAVVLATYTMTRDRAADPETAMNATEIAMAAAVAAWNAAAADNRDFETRLIGDVCRQILELYPQSSRAGEARMRLGSVYRTMGQPQQAVKWFLEVPDSDPQYVSARLSAGQAWWAAWTDAMAAAAGDPENEQPPAAELDKWKADAQTLLVEGVGIARERLGDATLPGDELVAAEVSLAGILNQDGKYAESIQRLTSGGEFSVVNAIRVDEGTPRPAAGIFSRSFASLTYRLLLRAQVGTQQIDEALATMTDLEKVGGEDIVAAYTQLGMELQEELKRLARSGDTERRDQVRTSFEEFLRKVYESRDASNYNSLLWIAETYFGLAQGSEGDDVAAAGYFDRAGETYTELLDLPEAGQSRNAIRLRLSRCRRQQQRFDDALQVVQQILDENAMNLDAQFEAALVLSDWGENGDAKRFIEAIQGPRSETGEATSVWGWTALCRRLQQIVMQDPQSEFRSRFYEARFELSSSRRRMAGVETDQATAKKQLTSALAEISSFVQAYRTIDDVAFARFDRLYQDIQTDLGRAPTPLNRVSSETAADDEVLSDAVAAAANPTGTAAAETPDDANGFLGMLVGGVLVLGGAAFAVVIVVTMRKPRKRARVPGTPSKAPAIDPDLPGVAGGAIPTGIEIGDAPAEADFSGLGHIEAPGRGAARRPPRRPDGGSRPTGEGRPRGPRPPRPAGEPGSRPARPPGGDGVRRRRRPPEGPGGTEPRSGGK